MRTVLVANRGEIAVRILRACRELGLRTVAVFSDADAAAPHVAMADEAVRIGPAPARSSYLDVDAILDAAKSTGADAVHPGYGLLSEDAAFAAAVTAAGLMFVGPAADVVARMGDKVAARAVAVACGVPVPPGSGPVTAASARAAAEGIGFPLVVKATHGGGGRGMRVVTGAEGLDGAVAAAGREAAASFGRSEVHLERYLERPRHVEVQVVGDTHATIVHLGDRDCSVQRRHQKLIEEAPAPGLDPGLRTALADAAVRLARTVGYVGAGTVEFLVLPGTGEFFFLEMNTRLQVEHGVTELVTGLDLVATQLRVAAGEPLAFSQDDVVIRGHAIQARIAAEDPWEGFRPAPGRVDTLVLPQGPGVRNDFGVSHEGTVAPEYDSMFGKVLAHGADRESARRRLVGALDELRVEGIPTTAPYLRSVLDSASFIAATHDTGSVGREWAPDPGARPHAPVPQRGENSRRVRIATDRGVVEVDVHGAVPRAVPRAARASHVPAGSIGATDAPAVAPMDATVVEVRVAVGQQVAAGDVVAVLEAMKMEMEVRAGVAGEVTAVLVEAGAPVAAGGPLISLT
ncbi:acetyl-CoA carboxylase biotin carboxylase subunit [Pseudonocardia sulfidoxydans NBRC 16205]|uniref:Acetyl-CoA carboxylase biotin carboxylase subunit n=1 Tax=Pseudonocardia sulfidoxydans NBRC 16205 TaxID=1223511 RepID=A0A511DCX1_9PSEU|nr:biotin carboxylase N-terminal domain-containing protein [Pseudonocardia sulfidoxydans]GEL22642.1 acetyl-CoA carboxylase biotin carboxylase subunit [Pseudonocardia sulfidoxydans NBRC 16205]